MKRRWPCSWMLALLVGVAVVELTLPEGDASAFKRKRPGKAKGKGKGKGKGRGKKFGRAAAASATVVAETPPAAPADEVVDAVLAAPDPSIPITVGAAAVKAAPPVAARSPVAVKLAPTAPRAANAPKRLLDGVRQLVVVSAPDWGSNAGELRRYERSDGYGAWRALGDAVPVALGQKGMAWGRGFYGSAPAAPVKREDDDRSVAGAFLLGPAFGDESFAQAGVRVPFTVIKGGVECISDPGSSRYNHIVDKEAIKDPDWHASEHMVRPDSIYRVGLVVQHNTEDPSPGAGSCVFLHATRGASTPTEGGTGMDKNVLGEMLYWIDPAAKPVLVQLPEAERVRHLGDWGLPIDDGASEAAAPTLTFDVPAEGTPAAAPLRRRAKRRHR